MYKMGLLLIGIPAIIGMGVLLVKTTHEPKPVRVPVKKDQFLFIRILSIYLYSYLHSSRNLNTYLHLIKQLKKLLDFFVNKKLRNSSMNFEVIHYLGKLTIYGVNIFGSL